jgi:hypothetical protein
MVSFHSRQKIEHIINKPGADESMLTAYFKANGVHEFARNNLYSDFLEFFTWQSDGKFWRPRKRANTGQVGRIVSAHLAEGERYYLRILLNHVAGATSYEDLRTVHGVIQPSFCEAAEKRGLMEEDTHLMSVFLKLPHIRCHHHYEGFLQQYKYFVNQVMYSHSGKNTWTQCLRIIIATIHQMLSLSKWS